MTPVLQTAVGLAIPFVGTALGAAAVFLFKSNIPPRVQKILLGFASGVMLAASVWSLLLSRGDRVSFGTGSAYGSAAFRAKAGHGRRQFFFVGVGGDFAQCAGGYGGGRGVCRYAGR